MIESEVGDRTVMALAGGSVIGDVYAIYWVWDRIRVQGGLSRIQARRRPALEIRLSPAWGRRGSDGSSPEEMRNALRYGLNWVSGSAVLDLAPWSSEPERAANETNRQRARELIRYAHALHLNFFSFANEFTYHPSLLREFGGALSPDDPKFWDAIQAKFRRLFEALPELDGIELCTDDLSGFWDEYRAFDVMRGAPECEWPLEKRYRTFVQKVHQVVAGEFHKSYFHFTWSLNSYQQHNQPEVFRKIFTSQIPTNNLVLIPKITAADRWWFQPYNSTFNLTPHRTLVAFETMNYYETSEAHLFPTFAGAYEQAGLQFFLRAPAGNVCGAAYRAALNPDDWDTESVTAYVLWRLSWDPNDDLDQVLHDFCAIHFGAAAADGMARIHRLSALAYKYGLHLEPVSYGQFNSLLQIRVGSFPAEGLPELDGGKEHLDFLKEIYLRCKPWEEETFLYLDHGLAKAREMEQGFASVRPKISDPALATAIENRLRMTRCLIEVNNFYARTAFAYFDFAADRSALNRARLRESCRMLSDSRAAFVRVPGFGYQLFGVDQLIANTKEMLEDPERAEAKLARAPSRSVIARSIEGAQEKYRELLRGHAAEAVKFLHFDGAIDGRDILVVRGNEWSIQHLRWDGPEVKRCQILVPLPKAAVTVLPRDIQSRPLHQFILQQPSLENGYRVEVYLDDAPPGKGVNQFDLYYLPQRPDELGLSSPVPK